MVGKNIGVSSARRILVTGASGFVGNSLVVELLKQGYEVVGVARGALNFSADNFRAIRLDLTLESVPESVLASVDVVIHCAGRAHIFNETAESALPAYLAINTVATEKLALDSAKAGIRRFIFLSTIGVYEGGFGKMGVIDELSPMCPIKPYAVSKWRAEMLLRDIEHRTGLDVTIVRPCLVVGPHAPGNLERLARLVAKGVPLPSPVPANKRSFLGMRNLIDLLLLCVGHSGASGEDFVAADTEWVSTCDAMEAIAAGMDRPFRTVPLPASLIQCAAWFIGKQATYDKVFGDLLVDGGKAESVLGWSRRYSTRDAFVMLGKSLLQAS